MNNFFAQGYSPTYKIREFIPNRYIDEWRSHKDHLTWWKSLHENSPLFQELASSPDIIDVIAPILGTDKIQLWGCRINCVDNTLPIHTDEETERVNGVTVVIGLRNTEQNSLNIIAGSHTLVHNIDVPPFVNIPKYVGCDASHQTAEDYCKRINGECKTVSIYFGEGDFIILHGKTFHGVAVNTEMEPRYTIILQYCAQTEIPVMKIQNIISDSPPPVFIILPE